MPHNLFLCRAILSTTGKDHFLKQLEQIVDSVQQNRVKIERRQQEEKSKRDVLNIQMAQLIEKARQYAKVLKDFQEVNQKKFSQFIYLKKILYSRLYERTKILVQNLNKLKTHCIQIIVFF